MRVLKVGQVWEFVSGSTGEVREYELEHVERPKRFGPRATLRRIGDGGGAAANVQCSTLLRGPEKPNPAGSHWRFVAEAVVSEVVA